MAVFWAASKVFGVPIDPETRILVRADDSVIEDDGARRERGLRYFQAGAISRFRWLTDYLGLSETDAKKEIAEGTAVEEPLF